jgi:hypothetical protein
MIRTMQPSSPGGRIPGMKFWNRLSTQENRPEIFAKIRNSANIRFVRIVYILCATLILGAGVIELLFIGIILSHLLR